VNCDVRGHVLRSSYNLPVLYSYSNSIFIRDVHGEFGLIYVHLFDMLTAISSGKFRNFFCLDSSNLITIFVFVSKALVFSLTL